MVEYANKGKKGSRLPKILRTSFMDGLESCDLRSPSPRDPRDTPAGTWPGARAEVSRGKVCIAPKEDERCCILKALNEFNLIMAQSM